MHASHRRFSSSGHREADRPRSTGIWRHIPVFCRRFAKRCTTSTSSPAKGRAWYLVQAAEPERWSGAERLMKQAPHYYSYQPPSLLLSGPWPVCTLSGTVVRAFFEGTTARPRDRSSVRNPRPGHEPSVRISGPATPPNSGRVPSQVCICVNAAGTPRTIARIFLAGSEEAGEIAAIAQGHATECDSSSTVEKLNVLEVNELSGTGKALALHANVRRDSKRRCSGT